MRLFGDLGVREYVEEGVSFNPRPLNVLGLEGVEDMMKEVSSTFLLAGVGNMKAN